MPRHADLENPPLDFAPIALKPGTKVDGRFEIQGTIGRGPTAIVYRAMDAADRVEVALKLMVPRLSYDRELYLRLMRELRLATEIFHPRFVNLRNVGEWSGCLYLAMEVVDGRLLKDDVDRRGALQRGTALKIVYDTALALRALHKERITHRGVWPRNVIIEPNLEIKVMDFAGSRARAILGKGTLPEPAAYLAPEECDPRLHGDSRADVYNLGAMLFELVTGRAPFPLAITAQELREHRRPEPPPVKTLVAECPDWIVELVSKALRLSASERHDGIDQFLSDLESTATEAQISEDIEAVISDIERKKKARAEREAAASMAKETLPPLELPEPEAKKRSAVRPADFSPAQIKKRRRTWIAIGSMIGVAILLAIVAALAERGLPGLLGSKKPPAKEGAKAKGDIDQSDKAKLAIEGLDDGFPGDDEGHLQDLVALGSAALPTLRSHANWPNLVVRTYVARAMGAIDAEATRQDLEKLTSDAEPEVRRAALQALASARGVTPEVVSRAIASASPVEQKLGLELVSKGLAELPVATLEPLLSSPNDSVRAATARTLGAMEDAAAPTLLIRCLSDPSSRVREEAAGSLSSFASEELVDHLIPILSDAAPGVATAAAGTLATCFSPELKERWGLEAEGAAGRSESLYLTVALLKAGNSKLRDLLRGDIQSPAPGPRAYAAAALAAADDRDAILAMEQSLALRRTRFSQRPLSAALAALGSEKHMARIVAALRSQNPEKASFAASLLAEIGDPKVVSALAQAMTPDLPPEVKTALVSAMARLGSFDARHEDLLGSDNREARRESAWVFGLAGDTSKTGRILEIRNQEEDHERALLFDVALGQLGHRPTLDRFRRQIATGGPIERELAARFFTLLGRPDDIAAVLPLLKDERPEVRAQACLAFAAMRHPRALDLVRPLFSDGSSRVREAAALAMYRLGDEEVVGAIARELKDADPERRAEGCTKLGMLRSPLGIPALLSALSDDARYGRAKRRGPGQRGRKSEIYSRVVDDAVAALEAITTFSSGYDPWALDEDQALAIDKLRAHIIVEIPDPKGAELL